MLIYGTASYCPDPRSTYVAVEQTRVWHGSQPLHASPSASRSTDRAPSRPIPPLPAVCRKHPLVLPADNSSAARQGVVRLPEGWRAAVRAVAERVGSELRLPQVRAAGEQAVWWPLRVG